MPKRPVGACTRIVTNDTGEEPVRVNGSGTPSNQRPRIQTGGRAERRQHRAEPRTERVPNRRRREERLKPGKRNVVVALASAEEQTIVRERRWVSAKEFAWSERHRHRPDIERDRVVAAVAPRLDEDSVFQLVRDDLGPGVAKVDNPVSR